MPARATGRSPRARPLGRGPLETRISDVRGAPGTAVATPSPSPSPTSPFERVCASSSGTTPPPSAPCGPSSPARGGRCSARSPSQATRARPRPRRRPVLPGTGRARAAVRRVASLLVRGRRPPHGLRGGAHRGPLHRPRAHRRAVSDEQATAVNRALVPRRRPRAQPSTFAAASRPPAGRTLARASFAALADAHRVAPRAHVRRGRARGREFTRPMGGRRRRRGGAGLLATRCTRRATPRGIVCAPG